MLIERDGPADRRAARSLLRGALADYDQIGMPRHLEMARALLHSTGARHRPSGGTATKRSARTMP
jgi:hypothetical protein